MKRHVPLLFAFALAAGCATQPANEARELLAQGRGEEALALLEQQMKEKADPASRAEYFRMRELLAAQWLSQAEALRLAEQFELAAALYRRIQKHDPSNPRAQAGLAQIEADVRHRARVAQAEKLFKAGKYQDAQDLLRPVLAENPRHRDARRLSREIEDRLAKPEFAIARLKTASGKPISLELREVTLRAMFDVLARASGLNFVLDKDVRADQRTSLTVRNQDIEDVMRLILMTNQLGYSIVNETTVVVFPNTAQKLRDYQEMVVKAFYLTNADVRQTANLIRTVVRTRDLFIDEKLNLLVIKDTPSAVRLAEKLIATQDLAEPEVMLEVEVLEIGTSRLLELGLRFPDAIAWSLVGGAASAAPGSPPSTTAGTPGVVSLPEWLGRGSELVRLTFSDPLFLLMLRQQDGSTSVLANPRIRVRNKEKAKIHIGDRVPVITTTAAAVGAFVSESVSYLDVGLKLEVEPLIYLDDDVAIKVGLEVSNIVREVRGANSSTLAYQIGTRNASTLLRLRDGETQMLAGLISDEDRRNANRVPGLGELPAIGRLFSQTRDSAAKTEIVLLITPRLVRTIARPDARSVSFTAGTETSSGSPALGTAPPPALPAPPQKPAAEQPAPRALVPFGGLQPSAPAQ